MTENAVKQKLLAGEAVFGTFFELGGGTAMECLGLAGLDFTIIDTEHGPFDVESAMEYIRVAELHNITPMVRVKDVTRPSVLKMLDVGAKALVVPNIHTVDEVKRLVEFGKYYPVGRRGFAHTRNSGFGFREEAADVDAYFAMCNRESLLLPQCETVGCLEHIDEITGLEGVDGIFVGPYDLSISLGHPAQVDHPEVAAAIDKVLAACKTAGKFCFIYTGFMDKAKELKAKGFDGIAYGMDAITLINAFRSAVEEFRK